MFDDLERQQKQQNKDKQSSDVSKQSDVGRLEKQEPESAPPSQSALPQPPSSQPPPSQPPSPMIPKDDFSQRIEKLRETGEKGISKKALYATVGVIVLLLIGGGAVAGYKYWPQISKTLGIKSDKGVVCTMDAKECPDGSFVARIPPDCEFAQCPAMEEESSSAPSSAKATDGKEAAEDKEEEVEEEMDTSSADVEAMADEDWQTYQNEEYGFEVKYPINWNYSEALGYTIYFDSTDNLNHISIVYYFDFPPEELQSLSSLDYSANNREILKDYLEQINNYNWSLFELSEFFSDKKEKALEGTGGIAPWELEPIVAGTYFEGNKGVRFFSNLDLQDFKTILSTFKFIEPTITDTTDWQTYQNKEYGFEVNYPEYWREQQPTGNVVLELITEYLPEGGDPSSVFGDRLTISIKENKEKLTLKELIDLDKKNSSYIYSIEKYDILDGYESFEGRVDNMGMSTLYRVVTLKDDQMIDISYEYFYKESLERFNQILSTFKFLQDSDNDGLFDDEEAEYGTDPSNPDSDGDGYLDGDEVENGYNPMGEGRL